VEMISTSSIWPFVTWREKVLKYMYDGGLGRPAVHEMSPFSDSVNSSTHSSEDPPLAAYRKVQVIPRYLFCQSASLHSIQPTKANDTSPGTSGFKLNMMLSSATAQATKHTTRNPSRPQQDMAEWDTVGFIVRVSPNPGS
jgi:hypothetical protein